MRGLSFCEAVRLVCAGDQSDAVRDYCTHLLPCRTLHIDPRMDDARKLRFLLLHADVDRMLVDVSLAGTGECWRLLCSVKSDDISVVDRFGRPTKMRLSARKPQTAIVAARV